MNNENDLKEVLEVLNKKSRMTFIGGNYEKDETFFNTLKEVIKKIKVDEKRSLIPIIAKEVFKEIDPNEIHEESLRLLHNCGFAVIDITNPAGQLMELERARDYGVVTFVSYSSEHPSQMPTTLSKVMENWGIGYLFKYEHIDGLKKFVKSMLLINHLKGRTSEELLRAIVEEGPKKLLLITSIGVLNSKKDEKIKDLLEKIETKIIITGWDFKTRGKEEAEKYGVKAIVCEGCILYTKSDNEFSIRRDFCEGTYLNLVKVANRCIINKVQDYSREKNLGSVVFFSQADEKSICYYLNPPNSIREKLEKYKKNSPCTIEQFVDGVHNKSAQVGKINEDVVEYDKPEDSQAKELLLYAIEKVNAMYRTFHPYSIDIKSDKVIVDLNPTNDYKEFSYRDVESIVKIALAEMRSDYEQLYNKVQAQKDLCIDIFCKSKDEIFIHLLKEMVNDDKNTLVVYLSRGTESDIPMIFSGYSSKYDFIAIGSDNVSERLKRAGVIPLGESITMVISNFLRDFESVNTT